LEEGGRTARTGFSYQDHIAVNKCLDMLLPDGPSEVWCEAEDDIMLVWSIGSLEEFELVQVKGSDIGRAWSVAKLCESEGEAKDGTKKKSIVEKSLSHDRGKEPCRFRIVTTWAPNAVLDVLLTPLSVRSASASALLRRLEAVTSGIEEQLGSRTSPNGNTLRFWVERAEWEHRASIYDLVNDNRSKLQRVLAIAGELLAFDQCEELHAALIARVQSAAVANGMTHRNDKRLLRDELRCWLIARARRIQQPAPAGGSSKLVTKLSDAAIDAAGIEAAKELRRRYAAEVRAPQYLTLNERDTVEGEVIAVLHALKVGLDSGTYCDSGKEFLLRCQEALRNMRDGMTGPKPSDMLLYGCMYEVMNRCLHRLDPVKP